MTKFMYWVPEEKIEQVKQAIKKQNISIVPSKMTPCEVLRVSESKAIYASPAVFNRMCVRQGSWYKKSSRSGMYLLLSPVKLPSEFDAHFDAEITESDFMPETMPTQNDLIGLVNSKEYNEQKPEAWEKKTLLDAIMFKVFFTVNRLWGWGDNLKKHWVGHKANHANFVAEHFTTEVDGEKVPYSVTGNAGVCSSCVEFFNITNQDKRKLVRACPGSITFGGAKKNVFLDIKPVRNRLANRPLKPIPEPRRL